MTITIADGRGALWQWDTGRRVKITDGNGVKQIHYQNKCFGRSVDVDGHCHGRGWRRWCAGKRRR